MTDPIYIPVRPAYPEGPVFAPYGLTKREYFAALFIQAKIQRVSFPPSDTDFDTAIEQADQLINALNRGLNNELQPTD